MSRTDAGERILDSALGLFAERGFAAVGVNEIGARAGLTGPAIYRHFTSKEEILAALFDAAMDRLLELAGPRRPDPQEELGVLIDAQIAFALGQPLLLRVYVHDDRALSGPHRRRVNQRQRRHVERWTRAITATQPHRSAGEATALAHATLGLILSVVWWPRAVLRDPDLSEHLRALARGALASSATAQDP